jgi:protein-disulfide isomerase
MRHVSVDRKAILRGGGLVVSLSLSVSAQCQTLTAEQGEQIIRELRAIREAVVALGRPATGASPPILAGPVLKLESPGTFIVGRPDAPITIVEFTDLQCPFARSS